MEHFTYLLLLLIYIPSSAAEKPNVELVCQGKRANLTCPDGLVIKMEQANYGRFSTKVCMSTDDLNKGIFPMLCENPATISDLSKLCDGEPSCQFEVSSSFLTSPANPKCTPPESFYLDATFSCYKPVTTTTSTTTTTTTTRPETLRNPIKLPVDQEFSSEFEGNSNGGWTSSNGRQREWIRCAEDSRDGVVWPATSAGSLVHAACPPTSSGHSTWQCLDLGLWAPEGPNTTLCQSDWTQTFQIGTDASKNIATDVLDTMRKVHREHRRSSVAGDLPKIVSTLRHLSRLVLSADTDGWQADLFKTINEIFVTVSESVLKSTRLWGNWDVENKREMASNIIQGLEQVVGGSLRKTGHTFAKPGVLLQITPLTDARTTGVIGMPSTRPSNFRPELSEADYALVPTASFTSTGKLMVYYASFPNVGHLMVPEPTVETVRAKNGSVVEQVTVERRVVSSVLSVAVVDDGRLHPVNHLVKPVVLTFHHTRNSTRNLGNPVCAWWETDKLRWSESGCVLAFHNETQTVCHCSHLTHFAVLMDVTGSQFDALHEWLLEWITLVGCGISIICLVLTFFAYSLFSKGGGDRVFIHKNLCLTLALAQAIFIFGISRTENKLECSLIAGSLLYLLLASLTWMLIEGFQLYQMLVEVFPSDSRKCLFVFVGYALPGVVTGASYFYDSTGFGTPERCWLRTSDQFILFFVGPAAAILLVNTCLLVMTMCIVCRHSSGGYLPCRHGGPETGRNIRSWVKGSLALVFLLGLTWSLGLWWFEYGQLVVAYGFVVCNSLQGLFIFLFHVMFADKMRKNIRSWLVRRGCLTARNPRKDPQGNLSPNGSGSAGSEILYNSSERYHGSLRGGTVPVYVPHLQHEHDYKKRMMMSPPGQPQYDYATISYGEMERGMYEGGHRVVAQPRLYGTRESMYGGMPVQQRPPPEFSPPPPPPNPYQGVPRALAYAPRRPGSKLSEDSAYSDNSSMLTTELTPQGALVLRMDLSKNPPLYSHGV